MGQHNLNRLFRPQRVAVIGASEKDGSIGNSLMKNLLAGGFPGEVLPVNPNYPKSHGLPCRPTVSDLEPGADLAIIATPIHTVPEIVQECIERKDRRGYRDFRRRQRGW